MIRQDIWTAVLHVSKCIEKATFALRLHAGWAQNWLEKCDNTLRKQLWELEQEFNSPASERWLVETTSF